MTLAVIEHNMRLIKNVLERTRWLIFGALLAKGAAVATRNEKRRVDNYTRVSRWPIATDGKWARNG